MLRAIRFSMLAFGSLAVVACNWLIGTQRNPPAVSLENSTLGIVADPPMATLEGMPPDTAGKVRFTLKNVSGRAIRVQSVGTTCGCSVAEPMKNPVIRPGQTESLIVAATPPLFGNRVVHVTLKLVEEGTTGREEASRLELNLKGKPLAATRVFEHPGTVEITGTSAQVVDRQIYIRTVEENAESPWITGLSSTSPRIRARIISSQGQSSPDGEFQRTYVCQLTAEIPQDPVEILAARIRLMSGASAADDSSTFHVVVRRRDPFAAFPAVLRIPQTANEEILRSVIVQAVDPGSLQRLEISRKPKGLSVEWLADEEPDSRRLIVRIPAGDNSQLARAASISLRDPQSEHPLTIQLIGESE